MRTKKITRYYCDHCSRGALKRNAMEKHEASCYSNPQRKCHVCFNRDEFKPVAVESRYKPIMAIGNECPYCLMNAVFKFNKEHKNWEEYVWYDLEQFRKDKCAWEN